MASFHTFQFHLDTGPVAFDVVCMDTRNRILEVKGVVHSAMGGNSGQSRDVIICCPLVTVNLCTRSSVLLDNRQ